MGPFKAESYWSQRKFGVSCNVPTISFLYLIVTHMVKTTFILIGFCFYFDQLKLYELISYNHCTCIRVKDSYQKKVGVRRNTAPKGWGEKKHGATDSFHGCKKQVDKLLEYE